MNISAYNSNGTRMNTPVTINADGTYQPFDTTATDNGGYVRNWWEGKDADGYFYDAQGNRINGADIAKYAIQDLATTGLKGYRVGEWDGMRTQIDPTAYDAVSASGNFKGDDHANAVMMDAEGNYLRATPYDPMNNTLNWLHPTDIQDKAIQDKYIAGYRPTYEYGGDPLKEYSMQGMMSGIGGAMIAAGPIFSAAVPALGVASSLSTGIQGATGMSEGFANAAASGLLGAGKSALTQYTTTGSVNPLSVVGAGITAGIGGYNTDPTTTYNPANQQGGWEYDAESGGWYHPETGFTSATDPNLGPVVPQGEYTPGAPVTATPSYGKFAEQGLKAAGGLLSGGQQQQAAPAAGTMAYTLPKKVMNTIKPISVYGDGQFQSYADIMQNIDDNNNKLALDWNNWA